MSSAEALDGERLAIYRLFLAGYTNGSSAQTLNISERAEPFEADAHEQKGCLSEFRLSDTRAAATDRFSRGDFPSPRYRLVDPTKHEKQDPGDAIRRGESVDTAVERGFAAGIFTFSEIVFNPAHTRAAFSFSFVCGSLCGHGATVVYELRHGEWKQSKSRCQQWVS